MSEGPRDDAFAWFLEEIHEERLQSSTIAVANFPAEELAAIGDLLIAELWDLNGDLSLEALRPAISRALERSFHVGAVAGLRSR